MANNVIVNMLLLPLLLLTGNANALDERHEAEQQILETNRIAPPEELHAYLGVGPMAVAPPTDSITLNRTNWNVVCDSQTPPFNCSNTINNSNQFTPWKSGSSAFPHNLTVDMGVAFNVSAISMQPTRSTVAQFEGNIAVHEVYLSLDGKNWGSPVALGTWWADNTEKFATFEPTLARYTRLVARSSALGESYILVSNFTVWSVTKPLPAPLSPAVAGRWGPTIDFPIVPAGAWVDPGSGRVITYSSYAHDRFDDNKGRPANLANRTLTSTWDPATNGVTQRIVTETKHDMFCPGMSLDDQGRMIVTGGRTNMATSMYVNDTWTIYPPMQRRRGYQSSVLLGDGRIFVIGGSWESTILDKCAPRNGEIFDPNPAVFNWAELPQCPVVPMLTAEKSAFNGCPQFRSDNHGWLFPWINNTVFQSGPSKAMNWYTMSSASSFGGWKAAGSRSTDNDAMCGTAVMYDATKGAILAVGGSTTYGNNVARKRAFLMSLNDANFNSTVNVTETAAMTFPRIYHSAVILPNGDTMVAGGRLEGGIFTDTKAVYQPEIFSPATNSWTSVATHSIPRNYHSFALLLPDATVLLGGGGLCVADGCNANHFDAQVFMPPYLFTSSGGLATRPVILSTSGPNNGLLTFSTDGMIANASLVRYGSATHGLNTDQRRLPLTITLKGKYSYEAKIPTDPGITTPGFWQLFAINDKGVPSVAATVRVSL